MEGRVAGRDRLKSAGNDIKTILSQFFSITLSVEQGTSIALQPCIEMLCDPIRVQFYLKMMISWASSASTAYNKAKTLFCGIEYLSGNTTAEFLRLDPFIKVSLREIGFARKQAKEQKIASNSGKQTRQEAESRGAWGSLEVLGKAHDIGIQYFKSIQATVVEFLDSHPDVQKEIYHSNGLFATSTFAPLLPKYASLDLQAAIMNISVISGGGVRLQTIARLQRDNVFFTLAVPANGDYSQCDWKKVTDGGVTHEMILRAQAFAWGNLRQKRHEQVRLLIVHFCNNRCSHSKHSHP